MQSLHGLCRPLRSFVMSTFVLTPDRPARLEQDAAVQPAFMPCYRFKLCEMRVAIGAVFFSAAVKSLRNLHRVANAAYDVPQVYEILELRRRICMDILRGKDRCNASLFTVYGMA